MNLIDRLMRDSIPEPNSGCWLWLRGVHPKGYGILWLDRVCMYAHRAAWIAFKAEPPGDLHVLHKCDVPGCINPDHLFLGTNADNIADKVAKGRQARGEQSNAKLTEADIVAIRSDARAQTVIAEAFGIAQVTVSKIKARKTWAHV